MPQASPARMFIRTRWGAIRNRILKFGSTHHHPGFPGQCQRPPRNHSGPEGGIHRLFLAEFSHRNCLLTSESFMARLD